MFILTANVLDQCLTTSLERMCSASLCSCASITLWLCLFTPFTPSWIRSQSDLGKTATWRRSGGRFVSIFSISDFIPVLNCIRQHISTDKYNIVIWDVFVLWTVRKVSKFYLVYRILFSARTEQHQLLSGMLTFELRFVSNINYIIIYL